MSNILKINGTVSNIEKSSYITSQIEGIISESTNSIDGVIDTETHYTTHFRVGNTQCAMAMYVALKEGDNVTVIGINYGELEALITTNHTTNLIYTISVPGYFRYISSYWGSIIFSALTVFTIPNLVGSLLNHDSFSLIVISLALIFCVFFAYLFIRDTRLVKMKRSQMKEAKKML